MSVAKENGKMLNMLSLNSRQRKVVDDALSFKKNEYGLTATKTKAALETVIALQKVGVLGSETIITALLAQLEAQTHSTTTAPPAKM